jgi:Co/Zn/Cd efflux system component
VPVFDGVDPRYKRVLGIVIGINGAMFLTEMIAGQLAGSQALKADALDFLADTWVYQYAVMSKELTANYLRPHQARVTLHLAA